MRLLLGIWHKESCGQNDILMNSLDHLQFTEFLDSSKYGIFADAVVLTEQPVITKWMGAARPVALVSVHDKKRRGHCALPSPIYIIFFS